MSRAEELKLVISEYEHHYAEAMANDATPAVLKFIHNEIKELKELLATMCTPQENMAAE